MGAVNFGGAAEIFGRAAMNPPRNGPVPPANTPGQRVVAPLHNLASRTGNGIDNVINGVKNDDILGNATRILSPAYGYGHAQFDFWSGFLK